MRVAIVHYWFVGMRGGEKVVEALCEAYPDADLFTHVCAPEAISDTIRSHRIQTTFIQRLPWARRFYQSYLPLMPLALEQLDLRDYDLIISSECGPAKGVLATPGTAHLCYCHSPMRYAWDMYWDYVDPLRWPARWIAAVVMHYMRLWDQASAVRVDRFVANSRFVASRIRRHYGREATVIHPPVDVEAFVPGEDREDFYLCFGELVRYKRVDLAVEAFRNLDRRLVVIGGGEELSRLRKLADPTVEFMGRQPFPVVRDYLSRCRALVFPGEEDFGMVPVEAMASGAPVLAYGVGGARETVVDGETGVFFYEQTPESIVDAVERFEALRQELDPQRIARHARRFSRERFQREMVDAVDRLMKDRRPELSELRRPVSGEALS